MVLGSSPRRPTRRIQRQGGRKLEAQPPDLLAGVLLGVMLAAAVLTPLLSLALLGLYRRAVVRGMRASAGSVAEPPATAPAGSGAAIRIEMVAPDPPRPIGAAAQRLLATIGRRVRRAATLEAIGALAYAAVLSGSWSTASGTPGGVGRWLALGAVFAWPGALAASFVAASTRRAVAVVIGGYAALVAVAWSVALARNPGLSPIELPKLWLLVNGLPSVLLLGFLSAPVRAVGPLVLLTMLSVVAGSQAALGQLARSDELQRRIVEIAVGVVLGARASFVAVALAGAVVVAIGSLAALVAIRRAYVAKRLSDQSIALHALWLVFACMQGFTLLFVGRLWLVVVPAAYLARTVVVTLGARLVSRGPSAGTDDARLLLLRVFALGSRGARQFGAVERLWRHAGSIQMIAGPDLATRTIEPHELLEFATGRLRRLFIEDAQALEQRVAGMDLRPDRDGRFRVNDFLCRDDTWRATLARLVRESDVVLMDLRGFGPEHAGCVHELRELVARVPLGRVVIAIDHTTRRPWLEHVLHEAARAMPADSPNRSATAAPAVTLLRQSGADRDFRQLLRCLCAAAVGEGGP